MKMVNVSCKELNAELTREELEELENAAARTIKYDEDSPEMTEEMLKQFKRMKQNSRTKQTASIRLSEKAQRFSKAYGKGYTSFLSRLIDAALDDDTLVLLMTIHSLRNACDNYEVKNSVLGEDR